VEVEVFSAVFGLLLHMWRWKCSQPCSVCYSTCGGGSVLSRVRFVTLHVEVEVFSAVVDHG
jgi:hypothetical protein